MKLIAAARLTPDEVGDDAYQVLVSTAETFYRMGGTPSLDDFLVLTQVEREAFVEARRVVEAESAALAGLASQGAAGAAQVLATADGGAARTRVELLEQMDELVVEDGEP